MSSDPVVVKEIVLPESIITLKSDGVVYVHFKKDQVLDVPLQLRMLEAYCTITNNALTPFVFEAEEGLIVTKEARDNAILIEESSPCKAMAIVVDNVAYAMIGNFYLKFNKPKRPYRVFKNRRDALEWLKGHL